MRRGRARAYISPPLNYCRESAGYKRGQSEFSVSLDYKKPKKLKKCLTNSRMCAILKAQRARVRQPESDRLTHESRVRPHLMTPAARSPVARDTNVNQQLRASERKSAGDGRTDAKPPHLRGEKAVRRGQKKLMFLLLSFFSLFRRRVLFVFPAATFFEKNA